MRKSSSIMKYGLATLKIFKIQRKTKKKLKNNFQSE